MSFNAMLVVVALACVAAALFWPRREDGLARGPRVLIPFAIAALLILALPTQEADRQIARATEERAVQLARQAASATSSALTLTEQLKEQHSVEADQKKELSQERDRSAKLERELAELRAKSSEEAQRRAKEAADLEARFRKALEEYADIERRAGAETVTWNEAALFKEGESALDCRSRERLSRLVPYLSFKFARNSELSVVVEGHTDNRGTLEFNKKLSEDRASAVGNYLVQAGVSAEKLSRMGLWFQRPAGSTGIETAEVVDKKNSTPELRQRNRRVEVRQIDKASR
jgi:outer membrane protein OmpA-like peptidoglycan-associated protein